MNIYLVSINNDVTWVYISDSGPNRTRIHFEQGWTRTRTHFLFKISNTNTRKFLSLTSTDVSNAPMPPSRMISCSWVLDKVNWFLSYQRIRYLRTRPWSQMLFPFLTNLFFIFDFSFVLKRCSNVIIDRVYFWRVCTARGFSIWTLWPSAWENDLVESTWFKRITFLSYLRDKIYLIRFENLWLIDYESHSMISSWRHYIKRTIHHWHFCKAIAPSRTSSFQCTIFHHIWTFCNFLAPNLAPTLRLLNPRRFRSFPVRCKISLNPFMVPKHHLI